MKLIISSAFCFSCGTGGIRTIARIAAISMFLNQHFLMQPTLQPNRKLLFYLAMNCFTTLQIYEKYQLFINIYNNKYYKHS